MNQNNIKALCHQDFVTPNNLIEHISNTTTNHIDTYSISPAYFRLTGRNGLFIYKSETSHIVATQHPHDETCLLIFPERNSLSTLKFELTASLLSSLDRSYKIKLARYTDEDEALLHAALKELQLDEIISLERHTEEVMDWKYPIHILSTETVANLRGNKFMRIRNKYRRAGQDIEAVPLINSNPNNMKAALKFWEGNMILNNKDTVGMDRFYHELFELIEHSDFTLDGIVFLKGRRPIGFTVWEVLNLKAANLFVNLADTQVTGISDYQLIKTCKYLYSKGIKELNLGGSELKSLDDFKKKYLPIKSIQVKSLDVKFSPATHLNLAKLKANFSLYSPKNK